MTKKTEITKNNREALRTMLNAPNMTKRLEEIVGRNLPSFCASIVQIQASNAMLAEADPQTIITAAVTAATLNLPISNNLGFAYIVPFRNSKAGRIEAQFQLGYKGLIQLAIRSGQVKHIGACPVWKNQIIEINKLTVNKFDFSQDPPTNEPPAGYAAYLELNNGYSVSAYMTRNEITNHAKRYSQTFKKGFGVWVDNFDEMALKTVLKQLLSRYAPLSIEMQNGIIADQAVIRDLPPKDGDIISHEEIIDYIDNQKDQMNESQVDDLNQMVDKPTPNDAEFGDVLTQISTGDLSIEAAQAQYSFTEEQQAQIDKL